MTADVMGLRAALADPERVAKLLGLHNGSRRAAGGVLVCCPVHEERTPSCSITRGPDGTLRFRCFSCNATGDVLGLVAAVNKLDVHRDFRRIARVAAELAGRRDLLDADPSVERPRPTPAPERPYPPAAEVRALWDSCLPVIEDAEVCRYLEGRALLPSAVELYDLGRALLLDAEVPRWARRERRPWTETGHRLLVPMFDAQGIMRSVRACRVIDGDTPKRLPPGGYRASALVMAEPLALEILRTGRRPATWPADEPVEIVIVEGESDWWTWATRRVCLPLPNIPTIGIVSGSWTPEIAARVPEGSIVILRTDHDQAGDRYAVEIAKTLSDRCDVRRAREAA